MSRSLSEELQMSLIEGPSLFRRELSAGELRENRTQALSLFQHLESTVIQSIPILISEPVVAASRRSSARPSVLKQGQNYPWIRNT